MLAYLDPASGSMILSVVAGGIAGIAVFFKSFGHRIWSAIAFWKKDDDDSVDTADGSAGLTMPTMPPTTRRRPRPPALKRRLRPLLDLTVRPRRRLLARP